MDLAIFSNEFNFNAITPTAIGTGHHTSDELFVLFFLFFFCRIELVAGPDLIAEDVERAHQIVISMTDR